MINNHLLQHIVLASAMTLALSSCSLEPKYEQPSAPVPGQYPGEQGKNGNVQKVVDIGWKSYFIDPAMQQLIGIALANNRDLRISALNVEKAAAQFRIQRSQLYPALDINSSLTGQHLPKGLYQTQTSGPVTYHDNSANVGISSWEIDFFGRLRSLKHQALETYLAQVATQRSERISLVAEVAEGYMTLAADNSLLDLAQKTYNSQLSTLRLEQLSLQHGNTNAQNVAQTEMTVQSAAVDIAQYQRQVADDINALQLLLGAPIPHAIIGNAKLENVAAFRELPAGLPSDLLTQRPDIIAAEETLKAANANIGVARAAFFPSISLTATAGTESGSLGNLFAGHQGAWTFEPSLNLPIFDWGYNQANLDVAKIEKRSDIASYEKTIQTAFREVADALAARSTYADELKAREENQSASQRNFDLATLRYHQGEDSSLDVLVAQRSLYSAQQTMLSTRLSALNQQITLYKTLGGGWKE
ncbi:efflux transporter outer membrane subunit [Citrobacter amalonaticus]